jgi:SOS response regulatory protein OraA/RecX
VVPWAERINLLDEDKPADSTLRERTRVKDSTIQAIKRIEAGAGVSAAIIEQPGDGLVK